MVYADPRGRIFDHPFEQMVAFDGREVRPVRADELIPLPDGSDFYLLPGRVPLGRCPETGRIRAVQREAGQRGAPLTAMATFIAPAYLRLLHPAYETRKRAPELPTFAYAPLGFADEQFWTAGLRVDPERRQDPALFDLDEIARAVARELKAHGSNRLYHQLRRCALEYGCRAAQNFFLGRFEAPLPTARKCNARCLGCISLQPGGRAVASHERIAFIPTAEEVAAVAVAHFDRVEHGVASFGQGCEGEPILNGPLLEESIRRIRAGARRGTVNLNTNASRPDTVARLMQAGLHSMRVSIASAQPALFNAYHKPHDYTLHDVLAACREVKAAGGFLMLNLLVFPGATDTRAEVDALGPLLSDPGVDMIQMRNLNVDPVLYQQIVQDAVGPGEPLGLARFMEELRAIKPTLRFGYFNPPLPEAP
jgi:pyruvate-formate lyase-activating enzyme